MEALPQIVIAGNSADVQGIFDMFFDIERNARLSGNADVLMKLDRIQNLMLGVANNFIHANTDAIIADSVKALETILLELETSIQTSQ